MNSETDRHINGNKKADIKVEMTDKKMERDRHTDRRKDEKKRQL